MKPPPPVIATRIAQLTNGDRNYAASGALEDDGVRGNRGDDGDQAGHGALVRGVIAKAMARRFREGRSGDDQSVSCGAVTAIGNAMERSIRLVAMVPI